MSVGLFFLEVKCGAGGHLNRIFIWYAQPLCASITWLDTMRVAVSNSVVWKTLDSMSLPNLDNRYTFFLNTALTLKKNLLRFSRPREHNVYHILAVQEPQREPNYLWKHYKREQRWYTNQEEVHPGTTTTLHRYDTTTNSQTSTGVSIKSFLLIFQQETPTTPQEAHQSTLPQSPLMSPSRRMLDRARVGHRSQAQTQQQQQARIAQQNETNQKMESAYRINTLRSLR